jgi:hypothetical protein
MKSHLYHKVLVLTGFLLLVGGCSKSSSPTSPSVPLTIVVTASSDTLLVGTKETFKATATAPDDIVTEVTGGKWSSSDPSIATVEPTTGQVTVVWGGWAIINVNYQGFSGSLKIHCLLNVQGEWDGSYSFETCNSSGDFSATNWCDNFPLGKAFPIHLDLTQDLETVTGRASFGFFTADVRGVVYENSMRLNCEASYESSTIEISLTYEEIPFWMIGAMLWTCRSPKMSGECKITATLLDVTH